MCMYLRCKPRDQFSDIEEVNNKLDKVFIAEEFLCFTAQQVNDFLDGENIPLCQRKRAFCKALVVL